LFSKRSLEFSEKLEREFNSVSARHGTNDARFVEGDRRCGNSPTALRK